MDKLTFKTEKSKLEEKIKVLNCQNYDQEV